MPGSPGITEGTRSHTTAVVWTPAALSHGSDALRPMYHRLELFFYANDRIILPGCTEVTNRNLSAHTSK